MVASVEKDEGGEKESAAPMSAAGGVVGERLSGQGAEGAKGTTGQAAEAEAAEAAGPRRGRSEQSERGEGEKATTMSSNKYADKEWSRRGACVSQAQKYASPVGATEAFGFGAALLIGGRKRPSARSPRLPHPYGPIGPWASCACFAAKPPTPPLRHAAQGNPSLIPSGKRALPAPCVNLD